MARKGKGRNRIANESTSSVGGNEDRGRNVLGRNDTTERSYGAHLVASGTLKIQKAEEDEENNQDVKSNETSAPEICGEDCTTSFPTPLNITTKPGAEENATRDSVEYQKDGVPQVITHQREAEKLITDHKSGSYEKKLNSIQRSTTKGCSSEHSSDGKLRPGISKTNAERTSEPTSGNIYRRNLRDNNLTAKTLDDIRKNASRSQLYAPSSLL